jgi:uncharacterized membrane protein YczE
VHLGHPGRQQRPLRRQQRGTGGDHVVDEQHLQRPHRATRPELRAIEPFGATAPGLRCAVGTVEQAATRQPQLARHRTGEQFGLVEPTVRLAGPAGGRPGDHVDRHVGQAEPADHEAGQVASDRAAVAVLQRQQAAARHAVERHGGRDAVEIEHGTGGCQREATGPAQVGAGLVACGAAVEEDSRGGHERSLPEGCDTVRSQPVPITEISSTRVYAPSSVAADWAIRLSRCIAGLFLFGAGIAFILDAHLGAAPWDAFHQGVSELTGISVGKVIVLTGLALLLLWIPLRQRPGVGTILNALEIGFVVDLVEPLIPDTGNIVIRVVYLAGGIVLMGIGSGLYIGAGLGPGPRDGIMLGLSRRGISVRVARTVIEATVLVAGWLLGGTIGVGTVAFMLTIGPMVQFFLPRLSLPPRGTVSSGSARP